MAVRASPVEVFDRLQRLRLRRVAARDVARVANPRHANLQKLRIAAAVRIVAVCAILHHRGMLPQERPAALGVAVKTVLVHRRLEELCWIRAAMRVVTTGAGYLSLSIRHVRGALELCSPHLMTLEAEFRLRLLRPDMFGQRLPIASLLGRQVRQSRITFGNVAIVNLVTIHASHGPRLVRASCPEHLVAFSVTREAGGVPFFDRRVRIVGEANRDGVFPTSGVHMGFARSVTSLAAKLL